jgi:putative ATP-dependent endonuclease of OLD family
MGKVFGQSINLQFTETTFSSILQSIKMVFFPELDEQDITKFRDIALNSLGYNNLLYIATVLAELKAVGKDSKMFTVLLIEEPEAHLHPQLQIKLIKYLESVTNSQKNMQIILTTHSPVLASSVSIDNIIHISTYNDSIKAAQLSKLDLGSSKDYINRWLDITKSTLLFAKGVILVEGISESLLIPELAKLVLFKYNQANPAKVLPASLEEAGVSVININGVNFKHFMKIFCNAEGSNSDIKLPVKCSGITDNDPEKLLEEIEDKDGKKYTKRTERYPSPNSDIIGANSAIGLSEDINESTYARLFVSLYKTFEYDLALEKNTKIMAEVIKTIWIKDGSVKNKCDEIIKKNNDYQNNEKLRDDSIFIYEHIDNKEVGKGIYAQVLGEKISKLYEEARNKALDLDSIFKVPNYIYKAVIWACGGELSE